MILSSPVAAEKPVPHLWLRALVVLGAAELRYAFDNAYGFLLLVITHL